MTVEKCPDLYTSLSDSGLNSKMCCHCDESALESSVLEQSSNGGLREHNHAKTHGMSYMYVGSQSDSVPLLFAIRNTRPLTCFCSTG